MDYPSVDMKLWRGIYHPNRRIVYVLLTSSKDNSMWMEWDWSCTY